MCYSRKHTHDTDRTCLRDGEIQQAKLKIVPQKSKSQGHIIDVYRLRFQTFLWNISIDISKQLMLLPQT